MPKTKTIPVRQPDGADRAESEKRRQEPLSGSKQVKNRNHSRQNHGEGS